MKLESYKTNHNNETQNNLHFHGIFVIIKNIHRALQSMKLPLHFHIMQQNLPINSCCKSRALGGCMLYFKQISIELFKYKLREYCLKCEAVKKLFEWSDMFELDSSDISVSLGNLCKAGGRSIQQQNDNMRILTETCLWMQYFKFTITKVMNFIWKLKLTLSKP